MDKMLDFALAGCGLRETDRGPGRRAGRTVSRGTAPRCRVSCVLLATRNAKKLAELRRILDAEGLTGVEVIGLDAVPEFPEAPETGATFEEIVLAKRSTRRKPPSSPPWRMIPA